MFVSRNHRAFASLRPNSKSAGSRRRKLAAAAAVLTPGLARNPELTRGGNVDFDLATFLQFKRLDDSGAQAYRQTDAPFRNSHRFLPRRETRRQSLRTARRRHRSRSEPVKSSLGLTGRPEKPRFGLPSRLAAKAGSFSLPLDDPKMTFFACQNKTYWARHGGSPRWAFGLPSGTTIGGVLLQIRCRLHAGDSFTQFMIVL